MYHAPAAKAMAMLAATAANQMPFLEPPGDCSSKMFSSIDELERNSGASSTGVLTMADSARGVGSTACISRPANSAACLTFSRSINSCVETGAAELRARGSSQAGILTSSASSEVCNGGGELFADDIVLRGRGSDFAMSKTLAASSEVRFGFTGRAAAGN